MTPDGKPFTVRVMVEGESRPVMTRAGTMIVQQWRQFGIDAKVDIAQGTLPTRRAAGDFDTFIGWSVETWGGHHDLSYFLDSWHSQFVAPAGQAAAAAQLAALVEPRARQDHRADRAASPSTIRRRSSSAATTSSSSVREMPIIPLMAYNVFTAMDRDLLDRLPDGRTIPTPIRCRTGATRATCSSS